MVTKTNENFKYVIVGLLKINYFQVRVGQVSEQFHVPYFVSDVPFWVQAGWKTLHLLRELIAIAYCNDNMDAWKKS